MSKLLRVLPLLLIVSVALGGGMVENTNQSADFVRMMARNASTDLDAVFFNPAGLTKLDNGMHVYFSSQTITQGRTITSDLATLTSDTFEGSTFAPVFPNFYAAYKMDKLVLSAGLVPVGGGGSAVFDDGLPAFAAPASALPALLSAENIATTKYDFDVAFDGSSLYMGGQFSASYAINDMISVSAGVRYFQASNSYKGHLKDIMIDPIAAFDTDGDGTLETVVNDGSMTSAPQFFTAMATILNGGAAQYAAGAQQATDAAALATGGAASLQPAIDGGFGSTTFDNLVLDGGMTQAEVDQLAGGLAAFSVPGFDSSTWTPVMAQGAYTTVATTMTQTAAVASATADAYTENANSMTENAAATADIEVDAKQTGSGFAPVLGLHLSPMKNLQIGLRYEMLAPLLLTNETEVDGSGLFPDGAETNADMPALLGIGVSYLALPSLNIAFDYNMYFNEDVNWDGDEANVENGSEIAVGVEFALTESLLLSGGYLMATSGAKEAYQSDLSYSLNSNTFGLGAKYSLNPSMALSLGFSNTSYEEGSRANVVYMADDNGVPTLAGNETYMKTATVFAIGLQKSF